MIGIIEKPIGTLLVGSMITKNNWSLYRLVSHITITFDKATMSIIGNYEYLILFFTNCSIGRYIIMWYLPT